MVSDGSPGDPNHPTNPLRWQHPCLLPLRFHRLHTKRGRGRTRKNDTGTTGMGTPLPNHDHRQCHGIVHTLLLVAIPFPSCLRWCVVAGHLILWERWITGAPCIHRNEKGFYHLLHVMYRQGNVGEIKRVFPLGREKQMKDVLPCDIFPRHTRPYGGGRRGE